MATIKKNLAKKPTPAPKIEPSQDASSNSPKKDKKGKKKKKVAPAPTKIDKINIKEITKETKQEGTRDTKYIYPEDVTSAKDKKDFRRKMRSEFKGLNAKITRLQKSKKPEDQKELEAAEEALGTLLTNHFNPTKS